MIGSQEVLQKPPDRGYSTQETQNIWGLKTFRIKGDRNSHIILHRKKCRGICKL